MAQSVSVVLLGQAQKNSDLTQLLLTGAIIAGLVIVAAFGVMLLMFFNLWLRAFVTGAKIRLISLMFMKLRKVNPQIIVDAKIMAVQAGLTDVTNQGLEAHFGEGDACHTVDAREGTDPRATDA